MLTSYKTDSVWYFDVVKPFLLSDVKADIANPLKKLRKFMLLPTEMPTFDDPLTNDLSHCVSLTRKHPIMKGVLTNLY